MEIDHQRTAADVVTVTVRGELDMETAPELEKAVREVLSAGEVRAILVDLAGVGFCDSSGLSVLDLGFHTAAEQGVRFRLTGPQPTVRRVLEIVGMLEQLTGP